MTLMIVANVAATFFMVGLIWFVQIVHYPLYSQINPDVFPNYEVRHMNLVTPVVAPAMFIEAITALFLVISPPPGVPYWALIVGLLLVVIIWAETLFLNTPQHNALSYSFDKDVHRVMVLSNWIRTGGWSLRGVLMLWLLAQIVSQAS